MHPWFAVRIDRKGDTRDYRVVARREKLVAGIAAVIGRKHQLAVG